MTPNESIGRLRQRAVYLTKRIEESTLAGKPTHWFEQDLLALDVAINALQYLHAVQEYEAAQPHDEIPAN